VMSSLVITVSPVLANRLWEEFNEKHPLTLARKAGAWNKG
jgi:hypothetical protein